MADFSEDVLNKIVKELVDTVQPTSHTSSQVDTQPVTTDTFGLRF